MQSNDYWFTEECKEAGAAFSMKFEEKVHEERTPYQHIEIYETECFGTLMVIDGFVMLTDRDNFIYHEMMSHPTIFSHPRPKKVLVIGGGDCGTLREVLKHEDIEEAWQVEIDERVTRLSEQYFPELCESNNDPRANFFFGDGIQWVKDCDPETFDIIIVDSTDPIGPAEGLFTEAFYRDCHNILGADGIIVQQSESPLYHMNLITDMRNAMAAAGYNDVQTINFPQCTYPSGWWSATMAGKGSLKNNARIDDIDKRAFKTEYYNSGIHLAAWAMPEFFNRALT